MNRYVVGSAPELRVELTDPEGRLADPGTVVLTVTDPAGAVTTYAGGQLTHEATGVWTMDLPVAMLGVWTYTWTGSGDFAAAQAGAFEVAARPALQANAPCQPWATAADVCGDLDRLDPDELDVWLEVASSNLYHLGGRRWPGECVDTVYPEPSGCYPTRARHLAPRRPARGLELPGYPAVAVDRVVIEGVTVDPARYRIEDWRWLVYVPADGDSRRGWPTGGEWSVTYRHGFRPPQGGVRSAALLGFNLALSCSVRCDECQLPERVQSITRQGVTMAILDPLTLFADGLTGLPTVDAWVAAERLGVARRPGTVWIPGQRPKVHRRTG